MAKFPIFKTQLTKEGLGFIEKLPKNLDGLRICRADNKHRNLARWIDLAVEKVSSSC